MLIPICIDGAEVAPIDDCGGIGGFYNMLEILNSRKAEDRAEKADYKDWLGLPKNKKYEEVYAFYFFVD